MSLPVLKRRTYIELIERQIKAENGDNEDDSPRNDHESDEEY